MSTGTSATAHEEPTSTGSLDIEFLALDLGTCTRCRGSLANIETALALTQPVLDTVGIDVRVHGRVIETEDEARRYRFVASPTIRIGGVDIVPEIRETVCDACSDLCGCEEGTTCREWHCRGETYAEAPVGLIVEALMRAVFGGRAEGHDRTIEVEPYDGVPDNLRRFFAATAAQASTVACCAPEEAETCCEPADKASCCGTGESSTCGCQ